MIIHSGVYEIIGVRCRATQTLYLSDLIEPSRTSTFPPYGQLQVGLFIAILQDAIDRADRLSGQTDSCASWKQVYSNTFTYKRGNGDALCAVQAQKVKIDKVVSSAITFTLKLILTEHLFQPAEDPKKLLCIANKATELLFRPNQQAQDNAASFSGTYRRHTNPKNLYTSDCIPVSSGSLAQLMIKFSTPSPSFETSVVDGTLYVKPEDVPEFWEFRGTANFPRKVVVKIAPTEGKIEQLHSEFKVYQLMRERFQGKTGPRIPEAIGFFIRHDEKCAVLVLERIGTNCGQEKELKGKTHKRTALGGSHLEIRLESMIETGLVTNVTGRKVREAFRKHVNIFHASGLVHGALSPEHLLCDPEGAGDPRTALISLKNVVPAHGVQMIAERQRLIKLLAPFERLRLRRDVFRDDHRFIAIVGPLAIDCSGLICGGDIPQSDPDCPESDWSHGPVERIHHSDKTVVELMIPFCTLQSRASFVSKWRTQSIGRIQLEPKPDEQTGETGIMMDFPVFLGPVSAKPDVDGEEVFQSMLREIQSCLSDVIPRHKSAKRIRLLPGDPECEWLVVPFMNAKDCEEFGHTWNGWGRRYHRDVACYCYTKGHELGLPYEFN